MPWPLLYFNLPNKYKPEGDSSTEARPAEGPEALLAFIQTKTEASLVEHDRILKFFQVGKSCSGGIKRGPGLGIFGRLLNGRLPGGGDIGGRLNRFSPRGFRGGSSAIVLRHIDPFWLFAQVRFAQTFSPGALRPVRLRI